MQQGGVETVIADLNREIVKAGHQCTVISNGGKLTGQIEQDGGKHITLDVCSKNPLTVPLRVHALRSQLPALRPTLIHAHSRVPAWLAWFANKKLQLPWVTTVHGFNSVSKYSEIMTRGDRVICVSYPVKEYILKNYAVSPEKTRVIHGGIDPDIFDPAQVNPDRVAELKSRFQWEGKTVISSIGRITELKDYETFIRAMHKAATQDPDICGLIVGHVRKDKTGYYDRLEALTRELDLTGTVHIATDLTDLQAVYAASDLLVSCSKKPESFGLTLIEALAMNTPVIATRHGGPLDIIKEGENGLFFEPGNVDELAGRIEQALGKADHCFRDDILREFNVSRMAQGNLAVYGELCTG